MTDIVSSAIPTTRNGPFRFRRPARSALLPAPDFIFRRRSASTAYLKAGILNAALHDITNIDDGCNPYLSE